MSDMSAGIRPTMLLLEWPWVRYHPGVCGNSWQFGYSKKAHSRKII